MAYPPLINKGFGAMLLALLLLLALNGALCLGPETAQAAQAAAWANMIADVGFMKAEPYIPEVNGTMDGTVAGDGTMNGTMTSAMNGTVNGINHSGYPILLESTTFTTKEQGTKGMMDYRFTFQQSGYEVSPWHDIPLFAANGTYNFVCEMPRNTTAKFEVNTRTLGNPIKQDVREGKLRNLARPIPWNYGMLPQTWEDPEIFNMEMNATGDNDPIDLVEIGSVPCKVGAVYTVKPLSAYALIDEGEVDWKIIAISSDDPMVEELNDVEDVERVFPGKLQQIFEWYRDSKISDGKPANSFGYGGEALNKEFVLGVINETHKAYTQLTSGARDNTEDLSLV